MASLFPFYLQDNERLKGPLVPLTEPEEKARREDYAYVYGIREYHDSYQDRWRRSAELFNAIQYGNTDDKVSNIYIPWVRMIVEQGIAMMSEGQPEVDFDPVGPGDKVKVKLWKELVNFVLDQSNWSSVQRAWITDLHVFGTSPIEVYNDCPYRTLREPNGDSFVEHIVRDLRRPKVGLACRPIWFTMRSPSVIDTEDLPIVVQETDMTWDQFTAYCARTPSGAASPYKNLQYIPRASNVKLVRVFDEIRDVYRVYAYSYGTMPERRDRVTTSRYEMGIPILDRPLRLTRKNGKSNFGNNVFGITPFGWGNFATQYDRDYKNQSIYGQGIAQLIEGPDTVMQALFNMHLDNTRLANTSVISYRGFDGSTSIDLNNRRFYSGDFVDGEVNVQSLGQMRTGEHQAWMDWLNNISVWITGINFQQLIGDTSKTATEFAFRVRANNQRAEYRLRGLENSMKRVMRLVLANALSELTVEEWEQITEEEADRAIEMIANKKATAEDYEFGEKPKKRMLTYFPARDMDIHEDFSQSKKRQANPDRTDNTLVGELVKTGTVSYIPVHEDYLYPTDGIESLIKYNVRVDSKRLLGDMKAQDIQIAKEWLTLSASLTQIIPEIDMKKQYARLGDVVGFTEEDMFKDASGDTNETDSYIQETIDAMQNISNPLADASALPPQPVATPATAPSAPAPAPIGGAGPAGPPANIAKVAAGVI